MQPSQLQPARVELPQALSSQKNSKSSLYFSPDNTSSSAVQIPSRDDIVTHKLKCSYCEFSTFNKQTLTNHIAKHTGEGLHVCPHCPFTSAYLGTFKRHMVRKHCDIAQACSNKLEKDRLRCSLCPFVTIYKKNMKKHMSKHTGEGLHKCSYCDYGTAYIAAFRKHMLKHDEEVAFPCVQCKYKGPTQGALDKHISSKHAERQTYSCSHCAFSTTYRRSYKNHILRHSQPYAKYQCSEKGCKFSSNDLANFKQHTRSHDTNGYHFCNICSYSTPLKGLFKFHVASHSEKEKQNKFISTPPPNHTLPSTNVHSTGQQTLVQNQQVATVIPPQSVSHLLHNVVSVGQPSHHILVEAPNDLSLQPLHLPHHTVLQPVHNIHHPMQQSAVSQFHTISTYPSNGQNIQYSVMHPHQISIDNKSTQVHLLFNGDQNHNHDSHPIHQSLSINNQPTIDHQTESSPYKKDSSKSKTKKRVEAVQPEAPSAVYNCKKCPYVTSVKKDLKIHNVIHKRKGLHTCPECPFTTAYRGTFKRHMSKHSKGHDQECLQCDYKSSCKESFDKHVTHKHKEDTVHQCPDCEFSTTSKGSFKRHVQTHQPGNKVDTVKSKNDIEKNEGRFECDHCFYSTDSMPSWKRHSMKHTKEKLFSCLQCSFTSECSTMFSRHISKHDSQIGTENGHKCTSCNFSASSIQKIKSHIQKTHSKSKTLKRKRRIQKVKIDSSDDDFSIEDFNVSRISKSSSRNKTRSLNNIGPSVNADTINNQDEASNQLPSNASCSDPEVIGLELHDPKKLMKKSSATNDEGTIHNSPIKDNSTLSKESYHSEDILSVDYRYNAKTVNNEELNDGKSTNEMNPKVTPTIYSGSDLQPIQAFSGNSNLSLLADSASNSTRSPIYLSLETSQHNNTLDGNDHPSYQIISLNSNLEQSSNTSTSYSSPVSSLSRFENSQPRSEYDFNNHYHSLPKYSVSHDQPSSSQFIPHSKYPNSESNSSLRNSDNIMHNQSNGISTSNSSIIFSQNEYF